MGHVATLLGSFVLVGSAVTAAAAQVQLTGTIIDDETDLPVEGARIEFLAADGSRLGSVMSGAAGEFSYAVRRTGSYQLDVARVGYRGIRTPSLSTGPHAAVLVEVRLRTEAVLLSPLRVIARSPSVNSPLHADFDARRGSGLGTFFTRADVERLRPRQVSALVARIPGFRIARDPRGGGEHIYTRDRGCPVQIWVDGFLLNPRRAGAGGMTLDEAVRPESIEGIEIYHGLSTVPAQFLNREARCGVVAVWTRRGFGS
jgi:hypothetical protein